MAAPCHAVATASANHVSFTRDQLTRLEVVYIRSDFNDLADKFVANHHRDGNRLLRPFIPIEDVKVGAANSSSQDPNEDVVDADAGLGNISKPQTGFSSGFDQSFHFLNSIRWPSVWKCLENSRSHASLVQHWPPSSHLLDLPPPRHYAKFFRQVSR